MREADAIVMDALTVRYRVALERRVSLKEVFVRGTARRIVEHLAIDSVSLDVQRGETIGIIGGNGAGKTTLLNVIARILHPSSGRLRIRGFVAPLIDLASGFHPDLTGRENVYLRGAFLGMSRRTMRAQIAQIEGFAAIGGYFDAALRTYSAGMVVRLAFAVVTNVNADILVIDEALAVGDAEFQQKCATRIEELRAGGTTFVIVSHDLPRLAALSDRLLWLDQGRTRCIGPPAEVVEQYAASRSTIDA